MRVQQKLAQVDKNALAQEEEGLQDNTNVVVIEAALLLEAGWADLMDEVWALVIPRDEAVRRVMARDSLSEAEAAKRVDIQNPNTYRTQRAACCIYSDGDISATQKQLKDAWLSLRRRFDKEESPVVQHLGVDI